MTGLGLLIAVPHRSASLRWDDAAGATRSQPAICDGQAHKRNDENYGEHGLTSWFGQVAGQGPVVVL
jgi:hypothetical protein